MFNALYAFLQGMVNWFDWLWRTIWNQLCSLTAILWGVVLICASLMFSFLQHLNADIAQVAGLIDGLAFPSINIAGVGGPLFSAMSLANTFVPLTELFGLMSIYISLLGLLQLIRFIKWCRSWL